MDIQRRFLSICDKYQNGMSWPNDRSLQHDRSRNSNAYQDVEKSGLAADSQGDTAPQFEAVGRYCSSSMLDARHS